MPVIMRMNAENKLLKVAHNRERLDDIGMRVILIPLFGITIPLLTGMVPHETFTNWQIKFSYLFTILVAFIIYEGSRFLHFTLRSYFDWIDRPVQKGLAILFTIPFFCVPVSVLLLVAWYHLFMDGQINWAVIKLSAIIITSAVFFLVNVYETVFAVRNIASDRINKEQLERAKVEAELEALKNQIDPHFIFNSLNTLSHLIEEHPLRARKFNDNLAEVYRYILLNKASGLVLLKDELEFLENYFSLIRIRFEDAVVLKMHIDSAMHEQYLLPPISLQVLVENAIKHNEFSETNPLVIEIIWTGDTLLISNVMRRKALRKPSSEIGLLNLNERCKLTTGEGLVVVEKDGKFLVHQPLLKLNEQK